MYTDIATANSIRNLWAQHWKNRAFGQFGGHGKASKYPPHAALVDSQGVHYFGYLSDRLPFDLP